MYVGIGKFCAHMMGLVVRHKNFVACKRMCGLLRGSRLEHPQGACSTILIRCLVPRFLFIAGLCGSFTILILAGQSSSLSSIECSVPNGSSAANCATKVLNFMVLLWISPQTVKQPCEKDMLLPKFFGYSIYHWIMALVP
jgi:hypothetical protein